MTVTIHCQCGATYTVTTDGPSTQGEPVHDSDHTGYLADAGTTIGFTRESGE